jgi:hypothetical protein
LTTGHQYRRDQQQLHTLPDTQSIDHTEVMTLTEQTVNPVFDKFVFMPFVLAPFNEDKMDQMNRLR